MEVAAKTQHARISAFKAREVTREIQGKPASDALDILTFSPKKAARLITKTLKSAIANAENNNNLRVETLVVKEAIVGEGPTIKRIMARARGSASPIRKRTSHIRITLTDEVAIETRETRKAARKSFSLSKDRATSAANGTSIAKATSSSNSSDSVATQDVETKE